MLEPRLRDFAKDALPDARLDDFDALARTARRRRRAGAATGLVGVGMAAAVVAGGVHVVTDDTSHAPVRPANPTQQSPTQTTPTPTSTTRRPPIQPTAQQILADPATVPDGVVVSPTGGNGYVYATVWDCRWRRCATHSTRVVSFPTHPRLALKLGESDVLVALEGDRFAILRDCAEGRGIRPDARQRRWLDHHSQFRWRSAGDNDHAATADRDSPRRRRT